MELSKSEYESMWSITNIFLIVMLSGVLLIILYSFSSAADSVDEAAAGNTAVQAKITAANKHTSSFLIIIHNLSF